MLEIAYGVRKKNITTRCGSTELRNKKTPCEERLKWGGFNFDKEYQAAGCKVAFCQHVAFFVSADFIKGG